MQLLHGFGHAYAKYPFKNVTQFREFEREARGKASLIFSSQPIILGASKVFPDPFFNVKLIPSLFYESATYLMKLNSMNQNNRADKRKSWQKECILYNRFGYFKIQTVDMSKMGLGVKAERTLPFKNGSELTAVIPSVGIFPQAKLIWTKKDFNNMTRLGLKLSTSILD